MHQGSDVCSKREVTKAVKCMPGRKALSPVEGPTETTMPAMSDPRRSTYHCDKAAMLSTSGAFMMKNCSKARGIGIRR